MKCTGDAHPSVRLSWAAAMLRVWVGTESVERKTACHTYVIVYVVARHIDEMMACGRDGKRCLFRGTLTSLCCLIRTVGISLGQLAQFRSVPRLAESVTTGSLRLVVPVSE